MNCTYEDHYADQDAYIWTEQLHYKSRASTIHTNATVKRHHDGRLAGKSLAKIDGSFSFLPLTNTLAKYELEQRIEL